MLTKSKSDEPKSPVRAVTQAIQGVGVAGNEAGPDLESHESVIGGNVLRAAVLGVNDGLVSNLSLVMGVAGAELDGRAILITGLAGLLAGASSMAMGEWLSVQSSRELNSRQLAIEKQHLAQIPEIEAEEFVQMYKAKGLSDELARAVAAQLMENPDHALDTMAREELGINPQDLGGSAWQAAGASFALFAVGAIVPVVPFFFLDHIAAAMVSLVASAIALFVIGAGITRLTGRSIFFAGTRQLLFGLGAAALTYGIGRLIGVSVSG
ncbi:MAG TPA: VIT1/CCC1 transporter family protein [Chloroflexia bacterium]|nr:VIT1/CCC1 transporter family protein [Chloroflexia bacterium]